MTVVARNRPTSSYGLRDQRQRTHKSTRISRINTTIPAEPNHIIKAQLLYSLWSCSFTLLFLSPHSSASSSPGAVDCSFRRAFLVLLKGCGTAEAADTSRSATD